MLKKTILSIITSSSVFWGIGQVAAETFSSEDTLSTHNEVRTNANQGQYEGQPIPNPQLKMMNWDESLAQSAQAYANECVWQHSTNRINVGENLYVEGSSNPEHVTPLSQAVDSWASEYVFYNFNTTGCQSGEMCGHYTQIVWQDSLLVGCAVTKCSPMLNSSGTALFSSDFPSSNFIVCHYGPSGNLVGLAPYDTDGRDADLTAEYDSSTEILNVPYVLVHYPDNLVAAYSASLKLISTTPYTFSLQQAAQIDYLGRRHNDSYDTHTAQLYLPNLLLKSNGVVVSNYAAVLQLNHSSGGFELKSIQQ